MHVLLFLFLQTFRKDFDLYFGKDGKKLTDMSPKVSETKVLLGQLHQFAFGTFTPQMFQQLLEIVFFEEGELLN